MVDDAYLDSKTDEHHAKLDAAESPEELEDCGECDGTGQISVDCAECDGGTTEEDEECESCEGYGEVDRDCDNCDGTGELEKSE